MKYIWLIPLLPGLGALVNGVVGIRAFSRKASGLLACATMTVALGLSLAAFWQLLALPTGARAYDVVIAQWIPKIPFATRNGFAAFEVPWGFRLDPLSGMMLLVVTGIGLLIHVYSTAYMADEPRGGVARFFCYLNLFCFFMLMLVLGNNFLVMFVGAIGKSAQIPLYVWLPDAMEGPTPVSALIHAATMVTAGVYMVGRNAVLFSHAPMVMEIVAIVGVLTALMAASIGLVQYDIKRVLAYSTVSQLGYMFTAMGVGAFSAGAFHLMTHAFFKALLFLGSGSVIHDVAGEQDMRHMGGLKKYQPVTFATMMIGTLSIAGIVPLAGFFSKDEILFRAFLANKAVWVIAVLTAFMTAFYMFRLMSMTFFGNYRGPAWETTGHGAAALAATHGVKHPADPHAHGRAQRSDHEVTHGPAEPHDETGKDDHAHAQGHGPCHGPRESPAAMTYPLQALAVGAIIAGFVGIPAALGGGNTIEKFLEPSFTAAAASETAGAEVRPRTDATEEHETAHVSAAVEIGLMAFSVLVALAGISLAYKVYVTSPEISEQLAERWAGAHRLLLNKYYVDELYNGTIIAGTMAGGRTLWTFDRNVVDGAVNGTSWLTVISSWFSGLTDRTVVDGLVNFVGWIVQEGSLLFRRFQTGLVQNYALLMLFGIFAFVSI